MRTEHDMWVYGNEIGDMRAVVGYSVEALDGGIGKIDETTDEVGAASVVVDTGPWIFGRKVILPAAVIERVDRENECVYVNRTKEQIKNAPELGERTMSDEMHRDELGAYYGPGGLGWREPPHGL